MKWFKDYAAFVASTRHGKISVIAFLILVLLPLTIGLCGVYAVSGAENTGYRCGAIAVTGELLVTPLITFVMWLDDTSEALNEFRNKA